MAGVIGSRTVDALSEDLNRRIPLSTSASFGIGVARGSGKSFEICKCLIAARYVLIVPYANPVLAR